MKKKTTHTLSRIERGKERDLSEDSNAALKADLGEEKIISQEPLLEPTELHQPPEQRRLLQLQKPGDHRARHTPRLDRRRQVIGQTLQRPPSLRQHHHHLLPVLVLRRALISASIPSYISAFPVIIVVVVVVVVISAWEYGVVWSRERDKESLLLFVVVERERSGWWKRDTEVKRRWRGREKWTVRIVFRERREGSGVRGGSEAECDRHYCFPLSLSLSLSLNLSTPFFFYF